MGDQRVGIGSKLGEGKKVENQNGSDQGVGRRPRRKRDSKESNE